MTTEKRTKVLRYVASAIGAAELYTIIFVIVIGAQMMGQIVNHTRTVYNYDPMQDVLQESAKQGQRISHLEAETEDLRQKVRDETRMNDGKKIDERLGRLESAQETNNKLLLGIAAGLVLMLMERLGKWRGTRRREGDDE